MPPQDEIASEVVQDARAVEVQRTFLPPSDLSSLADLTKAREFPTIPEPAGPTDVPGPHIDKLRRDVDALFITPKVAWLEEHYPVDIDPDEIGGVPVETFTPKDGIAPENEQRVLVNLHGGGFVIGAGLHGRLESMRIASTFRIKVLSVDYRQGPEHKFPAASEDVTTVYEHLLKTYPSSGIGIYGSSAGGFLTAQATAWIANKGLARPGAIGIFCASAIGWNQGDSGKLWASSPADESVYLRDADLQSPLVVPGYSIECLKRFPPTLILTSTRAFDLSSAVFTDLQLKKAGTHSELHVWDGLLHCDMTCQPDLLEADDANAIIQDFFDRHLAR